MVPAASLMLCVVALLLLFLFVPSSQLPLFLARTARLSGDIDTAYEEAGLRSQRSYLDDAAAALRAKDILKAIFCFVVGGNHDQAVELALKEFAGTLKNVVNLVVMLVSCSCASIFVPAVCKAVGCTQHT